MQFLPFIFTQENMHASMFYGKRTPGVQTRVPPADSDDEYIPAQVIML